MPAQPRRSVVARVVVAAATLLLVQSPVVRAEDDVTPPVGSISINGGAAFVASAWVSIAITASDDASGIAQVELANDGSLWTDVGLGSPVDWQLPVGPDLQPLPGTQTVHARFRDGAGNSSETTAQITIDQTGPVAIVDIWNWTAATRDLTIAISATDQAGLGEVLIWCNSEGPESRPYATSITVTLDDGFGPACTGYGTFSVIVDVLDALGNSAKTQLGVEVRPDFAVEFPRPAKTGATFTIRPVYPDGAVIAPEAVCRTEFRWGSDAALFEHESDESFGGLLFEGPASAGFCGEWTFTLPWVPVRQFNWTFQGPYGSLDKVFTASLGTTDPHISTSNLPIVYVLPSTRSLTVGVPVTYTLYRHHNAGAGRTGRWVAHLVGSGATTGTEVAFHQDGGSTFTFTPSRPGFWQVGWDPGPGDGWLLAAYYDPPAKRAAGGGGGAATTAPGVASSEPSPAATPSSPGPSSPGPSDRPTATPGDVAAVDPSAAPVASPAGDAIPTVAEREPALLGLAVIALVLMAATAGVILLHPVARRRALGLRDRLRPRGSRPPQ